MSDAARIVQKLWSYCNLLRDDGLSYGDYLEQLTFLLFLKMADEAGADDPDAPRALPEGCDWRTLRGLDGPALEQHYRETLLKLGREPGLLGLVFRRAQNKIHDPAKLRRLIVDLIDREQWSAFDVDVKGEAYEGLLEKNAQDTKSGAGQYFTPRPVINAVVACVRPQPGEVVLDPACGTGGFLLAAHGWIIAHNALDREQRAHLRNRAIRGVEIVPEVTRLCAMNLLLHGVGPTAVELAELRAGAVARGLGGEEVELELRRLLPVRTEDALREAPSDKAQVVLSNPPFGKKSSILVLNEKGEAEPERLTYERDDLWASTTNKQLNFVQHIRSALDIHGRAAVVVPDNVLFEGGAGETIRRALLRECEVHTLLRLPTGIFYAQGVKANVLFFDRKPASPDPWTRRMWVYDMRTNMNFTLKTRRLQETDLDDFVACYNPQNRHQRVATWTPESPQGRWRAYGYGDIAGRDKCNLDLCWLKDESLLDTDTLPEPEVLIGEVVEDLRAVLVELEGLLVDLQPGGQDAAVPDTL